MIKIINSANETQAILDNVTNPIISEGLNREFTFDFSTVIDGDKSQYITYTNKIEVEENYFNMNYIRKNRTMDGIFLEVQCEHVSYDLISANFTAGFTATGLFSSVATALLSSTDFTVGTVEVTASETINVNESTNAFYLLKQLASLYGGELQFNKYSVNLLTRRGADNGVQFRYRKNISNAQVIIDGRQKTAGVPKISYEISPAELEFETSYIANGYSTLESYQLGDTVKVIDEDLGIDTSLRIVKESHNTEQRMQGTVEISNFVDDLTDTLTTIQTTSVSKDNVYNGCSIGPENGFVAERSDELVQTSMNATSGIAIDMRDTTTASYTSVFYVQTDTATGTVNLYLVGNAVFQGTVQASDFIGGTITIGSGSNTFNANGTDGIWLGSTAFSTAPFSSTLSGAITAQNAQIIGDILAGSTFTVATGSNTIRADSNGLYIGSSAFSTAPFRATLSGSVTASDIDIVGGSIDIDTNVYVGNDIYVGNNDSINKYIRMRTENSADCTIQSWTDIGPVISFGYLNASASSGSTLGNLQNANVYADELYVDGNLNVNGNILSPTLTGTIIGAGTDLAYDTATNTLSLKDKSGATLSSVFIP